MADTTKEWHTDQTEYPNRNQNLPITISMNSHTKSSVPAVGYFGLTMNVGQFPFQNLSFYPIAKFNYQYSKSATQYSYADSIQMPSHNNILAGSLGIEMGNKYGVFVGLSIGAFTGVSHSQLAIMEVGYNFKLPNKRFTLQSSIAYSNSRTTTYFNNTIDNHQDVTILGEVFPFKYCNNHEASTTKVALRTQVNGFQLKVGLNYDITNSFAIRVNGGYWAPVSTKIGLFLKSEATEKVIYNNGLELQGGADAARSLLNYNGLFWNASIILKLPTDSQKNGTHRVYHSTSCHSFSHC